MSSNHYDPATFSSQSSLGYLLKINHSLMHDFADKVFTDHDVSFIQWIVLLKLQEGTALTASDLCRRMFHDNGAITRMLDQLEDRGYLIRQRSQEDRRVVELKLTDAGNDKVNELTPQVVTKLNDLLTPFSSEEFSEFMRLLEKLKSTLQDFNQSQNS
ncbi:HTH-type transcriptional regulator SarZ [Thalassocella blandensis]|nr:HTH-type transcriptional regulator SarZ [Thalassocella blandensis]